MENFKRDSTEVDLLMRLAIEKFGQLLQEAKQLQEEQICVRFFGKLELLPVELQKIIGELMFLTKQNQKSFLNICLAYTSRHEIASSVDRLSSACKANSIWIDEINSSLVDDCLDTRKSPDPDLLIRTSGEIRFSDFLLWQNNHSQLYFTDILWPECRLQDFLLIILSYQIQRVYYEHFPNMQLKLNSIDCKAKSKSTNESVCDEHNRLKAIESDFCDSGNATEDSGSDNSLLIENVYQHVEQMQVQRLQRMRLGYSVQAFPPHSESAVTK